LGILEGDIEGLHILSGGGVISGDGSWIANIYLQRPSPTHSHRAQCENRDLSILQLCLVNGHHVEGNKIMLTKGNFLMGIEALCSFQKPGVIYIQ
jgi:hypothetical protein